MSSGRGPSGTILVVEDERIVARDLASTLETLGYTVVGFATTAESAIQQARDLDPELVLMDITLGGPSDGIRAAKAIRAERDVPIIYLTAHSDDETLHRARETEPLGYLIKPFRPPDLKCAIEIALHKHAITASLRARESWLRDTVGAIEGIANKDPIGQPATVNPVTAALSPWSQQETFGERLRAIAELVGADAAPPSAAPKSDDDDHDPLERRVAERTAQLEAAIRELEAFNVSVAHDLRGPLRGISGFSEALLEDHAANLGPEGFAHLTRIRRAAHQMGQLIEDLLRLSDVSRCVLERKCVDLVPIARGVIDELSAREPERRVDVVLPPALEVTGDERLLGIVLVNLLGNAWKFTARAAAARIELGEEGSGSQRTIVVRDNGAGFEMQDAQRMFVAFQRLHTAGEFPGTGIGLAIVHRIVTRHGGTVWATGEPGRGAAVFVRL